jgi:hypothetical protein
MHTNKLLPGGTAQNYSVRKSKDVMPLSVRSEVALLDVG